MNHFCNPTIQKKAVQNAKRAILKKYNVNSVSCIPEIAYKMIKGMNETVKKVYGVDNIRELSFINKKIKETNKLKYGCESPLGNKEIQNKSKATLLKKYGVTNVSQLPWVKEKKRLKALSKYGVENVACSKEVQATYKEHMLKKYGVTNSYLLPDVRKRLNVYPNKKEKLIQELFPEDLCFLKGFRVKNNDKVRFPDLLVKPFESKSVIEHFGSYWHSFEKTGKSKEEHEKEVIKFYKVVGYKCLIVWEDELNDIEKIKQKIFIFLKESAETIRQVSDSNSDKDIVQPIQKCIEINRNIYPLMLKT